MDLCFFVMTDENYLRYVPLFSYFCFKAYPGCGVRILLSDCELDRRHNAPIEILEGMGDFRMQTVTGYPQTSKDESRMLKWVWADESFFGHYENVHITDVDILICQERISLEEQHLEHCRKTGLPYSNIVRPNKLRQLTGSMHFVKKKEYYEAMSGVIGKYSELLKRGELSGRADQEFLYTMIEESGLGFPVPITTSLYHGIHLGLWRGEGWQDGKGLRGIREGTRILTGYEEYFPFYQSLKQHPLFKRINEDYSLEELERMERWKEREWDTRKGNI